MSKCEVTGDAAISVSYSTGNYYGERRLHWDRTDPEIHVTEELLDGADDYGRDFLLAMYEIGERCPDEPTVRHARRRE